MHIGTTSKGNVLYILGCQTDAISCKGKEAHLREASFLHLHISQRYIFFASRTSNAFALFEKARKTTDDVKTVWEESVRDELRAKMGLDEAIAERARAKKMKVT